ncbi:MAG: helix-turn-helix domain-containing protein, partial [Planctomycetes bacterium]|nr:helix-turn-helix domain-containing protein [Planctomycetota bacterium]
GTCVQVLRSDGEKYDIYETTLREKFETAHARRQQADATASRSHLCKCLRDRRTALGVTQTDLAAKSGLDQALISKLESGRHEPRFGTLEKYANGLGLSVPELLR